MIELLTSQIDGDAIEAMSRQIGASPEQTRKAVVGALPLLMGALERNSQDVRGAQSLFDAVSRDHDGSILDGLSGFLGAGQTSVGESILGHVLGGRRGRVETGLGRMSGLDASAIAKLLPLLAPIVLGALGRMQRERKLDTGGLAGMLAGERSEVEKRQPDAMNVLGKLLDTDGDGDVMDDVARLGGGLLSSLMKGR